MTPRSPRVVVIISRIRAELLLSCCQTSRTCVARMEKLCAFALLLLLLLTTETIGTARAQWAVDDDGCRTPDKGVGTCVVIYNCKPIIDYMQKLKPPITNDQRELLLNYRCGVDGLDVKVCCPRGAVAFSDRIEVASTTTTTTTTSRPSPMPNVPLAPPDITGHPNVGLIPQDNCGLLQTDDRVLNGNKTAIFEFPWMVLISYRIGNGLAFRCGGTLINRRYILTAAHCITNLGSLRLAGVRLGEHDISKNLDCETHPEGDTTCTDPVQDMLIEEVIPHPNYDIRNYTHDIGLLRLAQPANISTDSVKPICLPVDKDIRDPNFAKAIVTGWGSTENDSKSDILLKVELPIFDHEQCKKEYAKTTTISHLQICAGGKNKRDSCAGDSGGPMQVIGVVNADARYIQYGVVSFGPVPCGTIGRPGVYTKVAFYLDWILNNMKP